MSHQVRALLGVLFVFSGTRAAVCRQITHALELKSPTWKTLIPQAETGDAQSIVAVTLRTVSGTKLIGITAPEEPQKSEFLHIELII